MKRIFLIGYMGAGKTTLGKAFSKIKGLEFIDLDWYIESRFHKTIPQLFSERGEDGFRELEKRMLHEVADFEDVVISTGGGTPCHFDNMDYMNKQGETVLLEAKPEVLFNRLKISKNQRPLLAHKSDEDLMNAIKEGMTSRAVFYSKAMFRFPSDELESREQIADSVQKLSELLNI
ncbi:MAG: shikimate kinase [Phocaeicola sp.]|uniref:shikimate kinase n=1 Tax=Phocaeicola TaxID=909656 RepID=UPI00234F8CE0|nr:shikimate kinase [Phocaeicola oris]MCE2616889.1 shikimate kinase [Phocaeicola oris]